jgi:hypothetical protein
VTLVEMGDEVLHQEGKILSSRAKRRDPEDKPV